LIGDIFKGGGDKAKSESDKTAKNVSNSWDTIEKDTGSTFGEVAGLTGDYMAEAEAYVSSITSDMASTTGSNLNTMESNFESSFSSMNSAASTNMAVIDSTTSSAFGKISTNASTNLRSASTSVSSEMNSMKSAATNAANTMNTSMSTAMNKLKTTATTGMKGVAQAFTSSSKEFSTSITKSMSEALASLKKGIASMQSAMKSFKWSFPYMAMPHIKVTGNWDFKTKSVPRFSVSWYEKGGVFDFPTLFGYGNGALGGLGENGAEAVVPLEKNTQWLDKIAERLHEKQGNTPIILQVDGTTFARISVDSINQLTKQTGNLPLVLV
jgi:hypothetical protein